MFLLVCVSVFPTSTDRQPRYQFGVDVKLFGKVSVHVCVCVSNDVFGHSFDTAI